jgi:F-type H+-transporting ATPase subunit delta
VSASVARRYAKAVVAVAQEQRTLEQTGAELQLLRALTADPEIAAGIANPLLSAAARRDLARGIAEQLRLGPTLRNFISLLADHRRLDQLGAIAEQYERIVDEQLGRVRARITAAAPLSAQQAQAVVEALTQVSGRTVLAEQEVDPALLGGVVVDIEGKIYDGSVRTQLETLAASIAGGRSLA